MRRSLGLAFVLAASALLLSAPGTARRAVLHDTNVVADDVLVPGTRASAFVEIRGATGLSESEPLEGAAVRLKILRSEGRDRDSATLLAFGRTDRRGEALLSFRVPEALADGRYRLLVESRSAHGSERIERGVEVRRDLHLHLKTDRAVYRPGQRLRWRVLTLSAVNARPLAGAEVALAVRDPRGTAVWRGAKKTDQFGMIAGDLPFGDDLLLGNYKLTARALGAESEREIEVKSFRLPPFRLRIETAKDGPLEPGDRTRVTVSARYHYGEPVAGDVHLQMGSSEKRGSLDERGRRAFSFRVPRGRRSVRLEARVTDGAGRSHRQRVELPIAGGDLRVAIIPERRALAAGIEQEVTVITTDGNGNLTPARISLTGTGRDQVRRSPGALRFRLQPQEPGTLSLRATARTEDGRAARGTVNVRVNRGRRSLRVERAVTESGEPIRVRGRWPEADGPVVLTLVRDGAPLARTAALVRGGRLEASLAPPPGVFGLAVIRATDLHWERRTGQTVPRTARAAVYLRPAEAKVSIRGKRRHRPGDRARLTVEVTDQGGRPVPGAGVAASVVDERVLELGGRGPDLVSALRALHDGDAEAGGLAFADLLAAEPTPPRRRAMRALLESLPLRAAAPWTRVAAAERYRAERARIQRARSDLVPVLVETARPLGARTQDGGWRYALALDSVLARAGWERARRATPWREPTTWTYAVELDPQLAFSTVASQVTRERLRRLADRLYARRDRVRRRLARRPERALRGAPRYLLLDPWGSRIRLDPREEGGADLVSAGPDRRFGTGDDLRQERVLSARVGARYGLGHGGGGGAGFGTVGTGRYGTLGKGGAAEARLRRRFDQTVLWVAGVPTGEDGRAELEVPLADSITGWDVEVEAVGPGGLVGSGASRVETFLPEHADVSVPEALTVGDRYQVRVVVANHGGRDRRFAVSARASGAAELGGPETRGLRVADGDAGALYLPLRATRPGEAKVRIALRGREGSLDRIERTFEVRAPGRRVRRIDTGSIDKARGTLSFEVPEDRAPDTLRGRLTLFRGAADLALDGLEGMLREPHGCFEQTSSATYPNLLVLELLRGADGAAPARERARDLVAKGYQRLISYEVSGGGFSWFGEAPANQVLTAYGLLEFTDMARVYPVDPELIERTRRWLVSRQRKDGSWKRDERWLHDWSAVQGDHSTTAYVAWALAESGARGRAVRRALAYLRGHAGELRRDPYLVALWAAAEAAAGTGNRRALKILASTARSEDGGFSAGGRTLFGASGASADAQVTALAVQALHRSGRLRAAERALASLWSARDPRYGWGTTQPTVLALRAAAIASAGDGTASGEVEVTLDGEPLGTVALSGAELPALDLPDLDPGRHEIGLRATAGGATLRTDLRLSWRERGRPEPQVQGLAVDLRADRQELAVGERVEITVKIANPGDQAVAMPTAVVPMPPGFRAEKTSLEALGGQVSRYEDHGSELYFYLEELAPGAEVTLRYRLTAETACRVTHRPAQAYAYYDPDARGSSAPLVLKVRR